MFMIFDWLVHLRIKQTVQVNNSVFNIGLINVRLWSPSPGIQCLLVILKYSDDVQTLTICVVHFLRIFHMSAEDEVKKWFVCHFHYSIMGNIKDSKQQNKNEQAANRPTLWRALTWPCCASNHVPLHLGVCRVVVCPWPSLNQPWQDHHHWSRYSRQPRSYPCG